MDQMYPFTREGHENKEMLCPPEDAVRLWKPAQEWVWKLVAAIVVGLVSLFVFFANMYDHVGWHALWVGAVILGCLSLIAATWVVYDARKV